MIGFIIVGILEGTGKRNLEHSTIRDKKIRSFFFVDQSNKISGCPALFISRCTFCSTFDTIAQLAKRASTVPPSFSAGVLGVFEVAPGGRPGG